MVASMCGIASSKANKCHDLGLHYVLRSWNFVEGNMNAERYTDILEDSLPAPTNSIFVLHMAHYEFYMMMMMMMMIICGQ